MPWLLILTLCLSVTCGFQSCNRSNTGKGAFPSTRISNGLIDATIYLPDTLDAYYRGARFDWSGIMPELKYDGHSYFGQWYDEYDPFIHDAIMGPVNDFYPLGYEDGGIGDKYVKIGIGVFVKQDSGRYSFRKPAKLIDPGSWYVGTECNRVTFTQKLKDSVYSYEYTKTVSLEKDTPVMIIECSIFNTGQKPIETRVYNHNFFVIDNQPTGPDFSLEFPFELSGRFVNGSDKAEFRKNKILFLKELAHGETTLADMEGFGKNPDDYDIRIENHKTGAGVRITCDKPISRLVFWASHAVVTAEPYTSIKVNSSEQFSWTVRYEFYTIDKT